MNIIITIRFKNRKEDIILPNDVLAIHLMPYIGKEFGVELENNDWILQYKNDFGTMSELKTDTTLEDNGIDDGGSVEIIERNKLSKPIAGWVPINENLEGSNQSVSSQKSESYVWKSFS